MIGYKPLLIGLKANQIKNGKNISLNEKVILHLGINKDDIIAKLWMKVNQIKKLNSQSVVLLEGIKGKENFKNIVQNVLHNSYYKLNADKDKNIYLKGNLYTQVKIAYSSPRKIYLISLGSKGMFNIFPTDLSGKFDEYFAVSLRSSGKANRQLESIGKCVIAEMPINLCGDVYGLGKNHMSDLVAADSIKIKLKTNRSEEFNLPFPSQAIKYFELERLNKIDAGVHSIHFMKIKNCVKLRDDNFTLAHIHRDYAEWRIKNKINTDFLFR
jgi:hypothetical protein